MTKAHNEVDYRKRDAVAIITLNRPLKLNAMNSTMRNELIDALAKSESDGGVRVVILTGSGDKAFCAGRDLAEADVGQQEDFLPMIGDRIKLRKPIIAAVNGLAYGAGWFLVQGCDLCVASEDARFALPEAKVGRAPAWGCWLHGVVPQKIALELLMTGNPISAARAYEIGLINHVVPKEQVMARAMRLAEDLIAAAPLSVLTSKEVTYRTIGLPRPAALQLAFEIMAPIYVSEDAKEGVKAFREKRAPVWSGC